MKRWPRVELLFFASICTSTTHILSVRVAVVLTFAGVEAKAKVLVDGLKV